MDPRDVDGDDMTPEELSPEQLAALLDADPTAFPGHPVAEALRAARTSLTSEPTPVPSAALSEFFVPGRVTQPIPRSTAAATTDVLPWEDEPTTRRTPVLQSIAAFLGTIAGKIVVGTTVAAASAGVAHGTGVVDIPGLPDDDPVVVETIDEDDRDADDRDADGDDDRAGESVTTTAAPATTTTTLPPSVSTVTTSPPTTTSVPSTTPPSTTTPSTTPTSTTAPSTTSTTVPAGPVADQQHAFTEPGVGTSTVAIQDGRLVFVSATPADGWTLREAGPDEDGVDTSYAQGDLEVDIDFEIEDGRLRIRVRTENDATDQRTEEFHWIDL